jgi:hypothetical protein
METAQIFQGRALNGRKRARLTADALPMPGRELKVPRIDDAVTDQGLDLADAAARGLRIDQPTSTTHETRQLGARPRQELAEILAACAHQLGPDGVFGFKHLAEQERNRLTQEPDVPSAPRRFYRRDRQKQAGAGPVYRAGLGKGMF